MKVVITDAAKADLVEIGEFIRPVRRQLPCPVGDNYLDRLIDM